MNTESKIKVWDPLVRFFHWGLVIAFFIAYFTEDDFLTIHSWAGYFVLALLVIRIVWGLIGTQYARFSNFIYSPATIKQFIKDTIKFKAKRYIGHNPAGGAMIILLILSLLGTTITGIFLLGADQGTGPLAHLFSQTGGPWEDILEEVHEFFANFTVLLVVIHISGVIVESLIHKENLASSMINGYKNKPSQAEQEN